MATRKSSGSSGAGGGFSLRTKDGTEGGGIEGALATITEIGFVEKFTYGGRQKDKPQTALRVEYDIEGFQKPWEQHYTVGPDDKYEVINDGDSVKSAGKQTGLNKKCSAYAFFGALEEAAGDALDELLPEIEDGVHSVRPLEGKRVRLTNATFETVGGDKKQLPVIASFEEDEQKGRGKGNGKTTGRATTSTPSRAAKSSDSDLDEKTEAAVMALLSEQSPHKTTTLPQDVYAANRKDPDAKALMALCFKKEWVFSEDRPWESDKKKGTISLPD